MSNHIHARMTMQQPKLSDDQLLSHAKSGNQQALGELCMRYNGMLRKKISSIVRHQEDTEDVLQDTFLSVYRHLHAFRETCKFSTWLIRIGINTSLMLLRKRKRLSETVTNEFDMLELQDHTPDPEQEYLTDQTRLTLRKAMQKLPPNMRGVMDLYYRNEGRTRDTAAMLGITEAAAKSRIMRARRILQRLLRRRNSGAVSRKHLDRPPQSRPSCTSTQGKAVLTHRTG